MSYSCYLFYGKKILDLMGLLPYGPSCYDDTGAPYRVSDLRKIVSSYPKKDKRQESAQKCLRELQSALRSNLESLKWLAGLEVDYPQGWSVEEIEKVLAIDPETVTRIKQFELKEDDEDYD